MITIASKHFTHSFEEAFVVTARASPCRRCEAQGQPDDGGVDAPTPLAQCRLWEIVCMYYTIQVNYGISSLSSLLAFVLWSLFEEPQFDRM